MQAQKNEIPPPAEEKPEKPVGAVQEAAIPPEEESKTASAAAAPSADNSALQEQLDELKEQVGQVAEAQKQEFLSKFNPAIGFVGETLFNYRSQPAKRPTSSREPISVPAASMSSNVPWNWILPARSIPLPAAMPSSMLLPTRLPAKLTSGRRSCHLHHLLALEPDR